MQRRLVLGSDRPKRQRPAVARVHRFLELAGIGADGEPRFGRLRRSGSEPDVGRQRNDAVDVGEQRVDLEGNDLGDVGGHLRQLDES